MADERFQYAHSIGWLRGLNASAANGGVGTLATSSPANVGKPPAAAANSGNNTFALMLTRLDPVNDPPNPPVVLPRCSFAVTLTTYAKTTNGENLNLLPVRPGDGGVRARDRLRHGSQRHRVRGAMSGDIDFGRSWFWPFSRPGASRTCSFARMGRPR